MARTKCKRTRIYRETMDMILESKGMTRKDFGELTGNSRSYFTTTFSKGYADVSPQRLSLWKNLLNVDDDTICAIPTSDAVITQKPAESSKELNDEIRKQAEVTRSLIADGFSMIHTDIRNLIETMDRYWKPTEPKYVTREREQP